MKQIFMFIVSMLCLSLDRFQAFAWTCFRYSDGTMSMTVGKVEEQVFEANKLQQNGHEHSKSEELQLEDISDNNNDEVIFSDIFSHVGVSKCRSCKKLRRSLAR